MNDDIRTAAAPVTYIYTVPCPEITADVTDENQFLL